MTHASVRSLRQACETTTFFSYDSILYAHHFKNRNRQEYCLLPNILYDESWLTGGLNMIGSETAVCVAR